MSSIPELRPNSDGVFYAHWSDARRSKRKSMGTTDPAVAQERFAQWLLLRGQQSDTASGQVAYTVSDCWLVYKAKHVDVELASPETADLTWDRLRPHFGHLLIPEVTQEVADAYLETRTKGRDGRKPVKPATVRRELQTLLAIINFCTKKPNKLFPASIVDTIALPPESDPRDRWLRHNEIQRLIEAAARLRRGTRMSRGERFLWLALTTAGRMSAILDLTWDRVDFETLVIHLDVPGRKKTKKRRASVPISSDLLPILKRAYDERINDLVMDNKADVWATIQLIAIEAGFGGDRPKVLRSEKPKATGISPHVLRHTAATHMARRGVPLWKIAKILGNSLQMIEKHYSHHCPDDLREAVDLIGNGQLEAAE